MAKTTVRADQTTATDSAVAEPRPAHVEIDLGAFVSNIRFVRRLLRPGQAMMAVVKANAYGHGLVPIAVAAEKEKVEFLGVAIVEEGEKLIEAGIKTPIVVLYPDLPKRASRLVKSNLIATVSSEAYLEALQKASQSLGRKTKVLMKVETGMGRYGMSPDQLPHMLGRASSMPNLEVIGVSTNLANAAGRDGKTMVEQLAVFRACLGSVMTKVPLTYTSIENSGGLLSNHQTDFNLVRVGILLYGVSPSGEPPCGIRQVMSVKSVVVEVKSWPADRPIGYGGSFAPQRDSVVAIVPIGYADGYPWSLSNRGVVLIRGQRAKVVGRVCMDAIMVDVTDIPGVSVGDEVVLLGRQGNENISVDELAKLAGSFSYEILSRFGDRLPRIYQGIEGC